MLFREIPFLRILLPLVSGIAIYGLKDIPLSALSVTLIIALLLLILSLFLNERWKSPLFGASQSLILVTAGSLLLFQERSYTSLLPENYITAECIVRDYPDNSKERVKFEADIIEVKTGDLKEKVKAGIIIYADTIPPDVVVPGNVLTVRLKPLKITNSNNPGAFNYQRYMNTAGINYISFAGKGSITESATPKKLNLRHKALITRHKMTSHLTEKMSPRQAAIVTALFLGDREMLVSEQTDAFAGAGAMHIMAVSGLHAGIISIVVWVMFFFLDRKAKIMRVLLTLAALWGYAYLTGLSPSVRRASIMFSLFHAGQLLDRPVNNINTLLASAFIILVAEPGQLFSTGFQMSYLAVLSLLLFFKPMAALWHPKNRIINYLWQLTVVSLLAQGATAAVSVAAFNRFPTFFLITNLAAIPLAFVLIVSSVGTFVTIPVKILSDTFATIASATATALEKVTLTISDLPGSSVVEIGADPLSVLLLSLIFFLTVDFLLNRKKRDLLPLLIVILLALLVRPLRDMTTYRGEEVFVYQPSDLPGIGIRSGRNLYLITEKDTVCREAVKHALTFRLKRVKLNNAGETTRYEISNTLILKTTNPVIAAHPGENTSLVCYFGDSPLQVSSLPEGTKWVVLKRRSLLKEGPPSDYNVNFHFLNEDGCFRFKPGE